LLRAGPRGFRWNSWQFSSGWPNNYGKATSGTAADIAKEEVQKVPKSRVSAGERISFESLISDPPARGVKLK